MVFKVKLISFFLDRLYQFSELYLTFKWVYLNRHEINTLYDVYEYAHYILICPVKRTGKGVHLAGSWKETIMIVILD